MVHASPQSVATPEKDLSAPATTRLPDLSTILPYTVRCTLLTPSGTVIAKGRAAPRRQDHTAEAYAVQLSEIDPQGVLEAMVYADKPTVIMRTEETAELRLHIDHITGSGQHRVFYCHMG